MKIKIPTSNLFKSISSVILLICISFNSHSQNPTLVDINSQLRDIFQNITYPNSDVEFLYDRSAKLADTTFYRHNSPDTLLDVTWLQLYEEMYYAAHDTNSFLPRADIEIAATQFYGDTIPIAIMDYEFDYCSFNSLTTSTYFIFDTINDVLYDNPGRPAWPFEQKNIFAVAALKSYTNFSNPVFRIDPALYFSDNINSPSYAGATSFRIDFGDGTGWHYFDVSQISHYEADYSSSGQKGIVSELLGPKRRTIKTSTSTINVKKSGKSPTPNEIINFDGMQIGVFNGCNTGTEKIIIYLEGIDIGDALKSKNRDIHQIYSTMIESEPIAELRNFNYTYYVVDWNKSTIDIRFNALYLVNLIEAIKTERAGDDEQIVIIGESMGGLVARFALTYMESKDYQSDSYLPFFLEAASPANALYILSNPGILTVGASNKTQSLKGQMHKTRELITLDTPHQGANIPIGIQLAYKKAIQLIFPSFQKASTLFSVGLESHATKQMLIYHLSGKLLPGPISPYTSAPEFNIFFNQLAGMGNYPNHCKLMALSNGAMDASKQFNVHTQQDRIAGDRILDFQATLYLKIFGTEFPYFGAALKINTNPNSTGMVYQSSIGAYKYSFKLKWFKIIMTTTYVPILADSQFALDVKPYCISAGGTIGSDRISSLDKPQDALYDELNPFGYSSTNANGCLDIDHKLGFSGFFGVNTLGLSICTDGFKFGFIPIQSALDYGNGMNLPLTEDILAENTSTKLSMTPFDVIFGFNDENSNHLNYRDEFIYNLTGLPSTNCTATATPVPFTYYTADLWGACEVRRSLLCLEIGDEELYLENMQLNRTADFRVQYDLRVNERNPYYNYPSQNSTLLTGIEGIFSKEEPFLITYNGHANFYYNNGGSSPTGIGFVYTNPQPQSYWDAEKVVMPVCYEDFSTADRRGQFNDPIEEKESFIKLMPNPTNNSDVVCEFQLNSVDDFFEVSVYDAMGNIVYRMEGDVFSPNQFTIATTGLQSGLYFVNISDGDEQLLEKLIVQ
jgi:hypothetical protein